ncbi:HAMP domain-containing histidine kinase [Fulvivirga ulvae]|uniref:sensor histidine kinase n=1 Tax=Fulvivirga ulvae TaxID=2904245 RepID=UPI001F2DDF68|nr:HAMP domain-containing sensor histidine kinase [Fulvivirga ulvae]UII34583.1 HAMP domain-containing histidine kinase [Fulvivirga ulvae]
MRLLQKSFRSQIIYKLLLVLLSIPLFIAFISYIIENEVDDLLLLYRDEFIDHVKDLEYLEHLETDLVVLNNVVHEIDLVEFSDAPYQDTFETIYEYDSIHDQTHPFRTLTSKVLVKGKPYLLTVRTSIVNNKGLILTLGVAQGLLAIVLVTGLALINRHLSQKLWKPFYKTLNALKAYKLDKHKEISFEPTEISEFSDLNKAVERLTERNRKIFLQQKEFIENLSHELQTPLAILHSKVDMLMQSPDLSEEQSLAIQDLVQSLQRLTKLNKGLLLLSKIENHQFTETETFDVSELVSILVSNIVHLADMRGINISSHLSTLNINGNKTLVEVLVTNLITNAIRYSDPGGEVTITTHNGIFTITNTGARLKVPLEKLFNRFAKGSEHKGTGLGLSIVKRICDTNMYELKYNYSNNTHCFSVVF